MTEMSKRPLTNREARIVLSLIASMAIFGVSAGATLAGVLAWHFGACGLAVLAAGIAAVAAFLYFTEVFP